MIFETPTQSIQNHPEGFLLHCSVCDESYLVRKEGEGVPMWVLGALVRGFGERHDPCADPEEVCQ